MVTKMKPEELTEVFGDTSKLGKRLEQQKENLDFLESNYVELLKNHQDEWIVVQHGRLLASAKDATELLGELTKTRLDTFLHYLADPEDFLIL
jgi:hypothetical protein